MGNQFYSQFNTSHPQYLSDSASPPPQSPSISQSNSSATKKKHLCPTCDRAFTTSGHLARHSRVHTGERNHKCPFPGCETRCSRQDNLQQHYRIHLSPGSRRTSSRSAMARQMNNSAPPKRSSMVPSSPVEPPSSPPPLSSPPALEQARVYNHHSTPPDSPPPLAHATLPATAHIPSSAGSSRSSSSPEASYSPINSHLVPVSQGMSVGQNSQPYSYRSGTTTYQEQSHGAGFTYVHTTPTSSSTSSSASFSSYSNSHNNYNNLPHINTSSPVLHSQQVQDSPNPSSTHSNRHSISHISPQPYSHSQPSSTGPPSPASSHSVSSHTSGPPTPSYVYHDDAHAYHHSSGMVSESALGNGHISSHGGLVHQSYPPAVVQNHHRFDSPPPTLAPIQDERYIRRDDSHSGSHSHSYLHHSQSLSSDYQYHPHQPIGLGHGGWKSESGMRKSIASLVR